jgi:PAS domain-containing protein
MQLQECTVQPVDATQALQLEIDRRRRAEQALLESEERHRCLFEAAPSAIAILGVRPRIS